MDVIFHRTVCLHDCELLNEEGATIFMPICQETYSFAVSEHTFLADIDSAVVTEEGRHYSASAQAHVALWITRL